MNMHSKSAFILASVLLTSCATSLEPNQVRVRIESMPKGAVIYSGNKSMGESPTYVTYNASEQAVRSGFIISDVYAVWPSGAKATERLRINLGQGTQEFVISRPADAPGLEIDSGQRKSNSGSGSDYTNPFWNSLFQTPTYTNCIRNGMMTRCTTQWQV